MTAEGEVETPLDEEGVRKATARLRAFGVTWIAVCFLHSFLNPEHELRAREIILDEYPDVEMVSLSHEILPKPPEFEKNVDDPGQCLRRAAHRSLPGAADGAVGRGRVHTRAPGGHVGGGVATGAPRPGAPWPPSAPGRPVV